MLAQLQPSIDTVANVPPGLTDLSTEACLLQQHFTWLPAMPALRRLKTVSTPQQPFHAVPHLHELRLSSTDSRNLQQLTHCTQLRVLQLQSHRAIDSHSSINLGLDQLSTVLRASAATLETIILGDLPLDGGSWAELAQCKQLRSFSLTLQPLAWEELLSALSQLPWFHTLGLFIEKASIPALPSGLLRHMAVSSYWRTVQLRLLHPSCSMNLLGGKTSLEMMCPHVEAASDDATRQVRFIVSKQNEPSRTYLITVDEHGQRKWQQM